MIQDPIQEQITTNKQVSSKKGSYFSTGKKNKKRQAANPQYYNRDPLPNQPYRVPVGKFIKLSPYASQQKCSHPTFEGSFNDPLYYRSGSYYQTSHSSLNQPILRKQPTFGSDVSQFLECVPPSYNLSSKHHHHHHYHHHYRNQSQDSGQYIHTGYLDQANPPLEVQRKMVQRRKQQSLMASRYNNNHHHVLMNQNSNNNMGYNNSHKQSNKRCQEIAILPTTIEKSEKQSSAKKLLGNQKENNSLIPNDLRINNNAGGIYSQSNDGDAFKPCSCSKSKCLKKYCECFSAGRYCRKQCNCCGCMNNTQFEDKRQDAIQKQKDGGKVEKIGEIKGKIQHLKGCTCKRSNCIKNYCECFQNNIPCGDSCKCVCCKNTTQQRKHRLQNSIAPAAYKIQQQQYFNNFPDDRDYKLNSYHNDDDDDEDMDEKEINIRNKFCQFIDEEGKNLQHCKEQQDKQGKYTFGNISVSQNQNTSPLLNKPSEHAALSKSHNNYSVESRNSIQRNSIKGSGILGSKDTQALECTDFTPSPFKKIQNEWSSIKKKNTNLGTRKSKGDDDDDEGEEQEGLEQQQQEYQEYALQQEQNEDEQQEEQVNNDQTSSKKQQQKQIANKTMNQLKLVGTKRNAHEKSSNNNNNILQTTRNVIVKKKKILSNNNPSFPSTSTTQNSSKSNNKTNLNKRNVNKSLFDEKKLMHNIENSIINTDIKKSKKRLKRSSNNLGVGEKVEDEGVLEQTKKPQLRKKSQRISQKQVKAQ